MPVKTKKRLNPKMNPRVKKKWLEALRSGKYRQGKGNLKYYDESSHRTKYCCLGVLCDISKKDIWIGRDDISKYYAGSNKCLSHRISKYAGVKSHVVDIKLPINDPAIKKVEFEDQVEDAKKDGEEFIRTDFTVLNDDGASFKDIANIIEEYL